MLLVAFSRRMCCSRVCNAKRNAGRPAWSVLTPTKRPGSVRAIDSVVAMYAAWGPPNPIGTPNRWADPIAMSAPREAADATRTLARGSVASTAIAPCSFTRAMCGRGSSKEPVEVGKENSAPKHSSASSRRPT